MPKIAEIERKPLKHGGTEGAEDQGIGAEENGVAIPFKSVSSLLSVVRLCFAGLLIAAADPGFALSPFPCYSF